MSKAHPLLSGNGNIDWRDPFGLDMKDAERRGEKPRRLYGRRKGPRLSPAQEMRLDRLWPHYRLDPESADRSPSQLWLEVGFGAGEHLYAQAERHPHVTCWGAEPYLNGIASLIARLEKAPLANIRLYRGDAFDLIDALPPRSLDKLFLIHPDPWPKARHIKRRFLQTETLERLAHAMPSGAELRLQTDHADYAGWALRQIACEKSFQWTPKTMASWKEAPQDWPVTRYAQKRKAGDPLYLSFWRK